MKIEVYHPTERGTEQQHMLFSPTENEVLCVWNGTDPTLYYKHVATVEVTPVPGEGVESDLDIAYEMTNTIHKPWWQNSAVTKHGTARGYRSTSVGDVLKVGDARYVVASMGFQLIEGA